MALLPGAMNMIKFWSPLLILFVYLTISTYAKSHHVRHHRDRFKRQQGAHLYLPGSYVTDNDEPEGGPWLDWSSPSPCTRTCGGGVSTQERQCTSGYTCRGPSKRHFSCNTQDCPDLADFRSQQCSEYDAVPFEDVYYQWIPYTKSPQVCELNCMPRGERFYYRHKLQVIDGTRCDDETLNVCVDGKCQPVGCDMMLGSEAKEDTCRVCGGDGSTCNTMTGLLDMQDLQVGYNDVLLIPAGAVNIKVKEVAPSNNYLAVRNTTGYYYLNGNWRIDFPRSVDFAGCKFHYDRYPQGFPAPDSITCLGPIEEALFVVLLYQDVNVGIEYEYSTPKTVHHSAETETYAWTFDQFTPCSASCGGGYQHRNVTCAGRKSLEEASSNLCDVNNKPVESQRCGETPCEPKWVAKDWEKCSEPCGDNGVQTRKVYCEQIISGGVPSIVDDQQCANIQKPPSQQPCNQGVVCAEWHKGPWKPCDKLCGPGKQTRKVTCFRKEKGKIIALEDSDCPHIEKPETEKKCILRPCEGVDWVTSEWSGCEDKCGLSEETRQVRCATATGDVYDDQLCEETEIRPVTSRKCEQQAKDCDFEWHAGQWSDCSAKCGKGVQTRKVFCVQETEDAFKKVDPNNCDPKKKYDESMNCTAKETICPGEWFTGPWTECSQKCGGGMKLRKVICMHDEKVVTVRDCDKDSTPFSTEECNKQPCDKEQTSSTASVDLPPAELTTFPGKEQPERDVELVEDGDYELVDDDVCEDGEFIMIGDKEKLISFGVAVEYHEEAKEMTFTLDDLMLSDSTYVSGPYSLSPDYGSGDYEFTKVTGGDLGSTAFDTSIVEEGSGDDTTYFRSSDALITGTTAIEGSGDVPTEVSEPIFISKTAFTVSGELTTEAPEFSTAKETIVVSTEDVESTPEGIKASSATETTILGTTKDDSETKDETTTAVTGDVDATKPDATTEAFTTAEESSDETTSKDTAPTDTSSVDALSTDKVTTEETTSEKSSDGTTAEKDSTAEETTSPTDEESSQTTEGTTKLHETTTGASTTVESSETTMDSSETTMDSSETTRDSSESTLGSSETTTESFKTTKDSSETTVDLPATTEDGVHTTVEVTTIAGKTDKTEEETTEPLIEGESPIDEAAPEEITEATTTHTAETTIAISTTIADISTEKSTIRSDETTLAKEIPTTIAKETDATVEETTILAITKSAPIDITEEITTFAITEKVATEEAATTEAIDATSAVTDGVSQSSPVTGTTTDGATEKVSTAVPVSMETMIITDTERSVGTEESTEEKAATTVTTEDTSRAAATITTAVPAVATTTLKPPPRTSKPEIEDLIPTTKHKMCRRRKKVTCKETEFGCCSDKVTPAKGPFNQGCPTPKTCDETKFGCCEDGISPAEGKEFKGCPESQCKETLFGCCPDNKTPAEGNDNEGCPPLCASSEFGCCKDSITEATGPNHKGCPEEEKDEKEETKDAVSSTTESISTTGTTEEYVDCKVSKYGCCQDGITAAQGEHLKGCDILKEDCNDSLYGCCPDGALSAHGPNYKGCDTECSKTLFGCCPDGITPAHGYLREGCCLSSKHGCCPDNINEAKGPGSEGCECRHSPYGCCPNNITSAHGPDNEGCGCQYMQNGCCPDGHTSATGAGFTGCPCHTFQFGCCPDGVTAAQGPHQQGCGCRSTEFGCCSDDETPAKGLNFEGCDCASSKFGCCLDGATETQGENFDGCKEIPENLQASCSQEKERGPCRNYTVKWFYDMQYGGCSRFWYGGCEGNGNRFKDKSECNVVCVEPEGRDRCKLPVVAGPCEGYYPQWYYDKEHNHCAQFIYGGCLGNNNRFETVEECNSLCVKDRNIDACDQLKEEGSCRGEFYRWYFDKEEGACQPFRYGGCEGNNNNFRTELACKQKCAQEGKKKEHCSLPRAQGNCTERLARWYYDASTKHCMPFYYTGCNGNGNNFNTEHQCEIDCPMDIVKDTCQLPAELGECSDYKERWYYDTAKRECRRFYYGGCGGNKNNFENEDSCLARCSPEAQTEPPAVVSSATEVPPKAPTAEEPFKTEFCSLPYETGPCRNSETRWYYDRDGACKHFLYGGCDGNRNNFRTTEECERMCEVAHDRCSLPKLAGPCDAQYLQWYYNQTMDACEQFVYGGCMGNKNRFEDEVSCERQCRRGPPTVTQALPEEPHVLPTEDPTNVCYKPVAKGNCTDNIPAYYYDPITQRCMTFTYTGCGGNANRYSSEEQCERQCGSFRGQDVCSLPKDEGPCRTYQLKYYFDPNLAQCAQFYYGGCDGNGNRFSTVDDCRSICVSREEPEQKVPSSEICLLPADTGNCRDGDHKRWYFDEARGECIVFIYSGCGGNSNRFKSLQACRETCRDYLAPVYPDAQRSTTESMANPCQVYTDQCKQMNCPYGIKAYVDDTQCNRCRCDDPCEDATCPDGARCGVEVNLERGTDGNDANFVGVCREANKTGDCPAVIPSAINCEQKCHDDADCTSTMKCCSNGCGTECTRPSATTVTPLAELRTPSYLPSYTDLPAHYFPPQVIEEEFQPEVTAGEGDYVMLRCAVSGNPKPIFTWRKDDLLIDGKEPRYRITLDGSALQIISLYKTDSGIYLCTADNKIGQPLTKEIKLVVQDPVPGPAHILDDPDLSTVTISLGSPATLNCYVYGYPTSSVAWFKDDRLIPMKTEEFTINKDSSLFINAVRLRDLGIYTCQAYNGIGKPSSWSVTVQALGPVYSTDPGDKRYMKYVVDRPRRPDAMGNKESAVVTLPTPRPAPSTTTTISTTVPTTTTTTITLRPRPRRVHVRANITIRDTKFPVKSDVHIPCEVDGYPLPQVEWYKNGKPIYPSDRIEITANYRLIIRNAQETDTGEYRCRAHNEYSDATSTTPLLIRDQQIHPNCTDNAFFANCKLIVNGKFCVHPYYAKFCCKSCTEAGQLEPHDPHLNDQPSSIVESNLV